MTEEQRFDDRVEREYRDDRIAVRWEPSLCIHAANCLRALPEVFNSRARPWVSLSAGSAEAIGDAVSQCPTGALAFQRLDGGPQEDVPKETVVSPQRNGPLYVQGVIKILDESGNVVREMTRAALCRCGASANKPFCDDSHSRIGFRTVPPKEKRPRLTMAKETKPSAPE